ncbi:MAG: branched-chain amino acid ABC transporter permease [Syntrophobacteraceae bacterium]
MVSYSYFDLRKAALLGMLVFLVLVPLYGDAFYTRLFTRVMIYGIIALSLDLILGYGGMVSLGHAAFFGVGAYTVGILAHYGFQSVLVSWPLAAAFSMLAALVIGAVSLRTSGTYFIMITLAFAQMLYYLFISLKGFGGSDGMPLALRNTVPGLIDMGRHGTFYYVVLTIMLAVLFVVRRLVHSRFGLVIRGIRNNERRMQTLGFATFRYKLACFAISAALAGLAGALLANQSLYVSPALMHWTRSGEILVMVILGGMGSLIGPVLGAAALLLSEEVLSSYTEHWMLLLGPLLIVVVLCGRSGIYGLLAFAAPSSTAADQSPVTTRREKANG